MSLDCIFADEEPLSDLAVAQTRSDQPEDFQFAFGDCEFLKLFFVWSKRSVWSDRNPFLDDPLAFNDDLLLPGELEPEPDADARKNERDQSTVNLDGVLDYYIAILDDPQGHDEESRAEPIDENLFLQVDRRFDSISLYEALAERNRRCSLGSSA